MYRTVLTAAALILAMAGLAEFLGSYPHYVIMLCINAAIIGVSLVMLVGYARIISLASAAFLAIGAYTTTILCQSLGVDYLAAVVIGAATAGLAGFLLGLIAVRFEGHALALLTLAFQAVVLIAIREARWLTGGVGGMRVQNVEVLSNVLDRDGTGFTWVSAAFAALAVGLLAAALCSRFGTNLRAASRNPTAASAFGIDPAWYRIAAIALSSAGLGVAGSLIAPHLRIIDPESFSVSSSILVLAYPIVGGATSVIGGLLAGAGLRALPEALRAFGEYQVLVICVLVVLLLTVMPGGLAGIVRGIGKRLKLVKPASARIVRLARALPAATLPRRTEYGEREHAVAAGREIALSTRLVVKAFGPVVAVDNVTLRLESGLIHGLIGSNGAGKTTLFNILCGAIAPESGSVSLFGDDVSGEYAIGRLNRGLTRTFQNIGLFGELSCIENVRIGQGRNSVRQTLADMAAVVTERTSVRRSYREALDVLDLLGLGDVAEKPAGELPLGAQRRLEIARAIVSQPRILLLDEPVAGIPVEQHGEIAEILRRLQRTLDITVIIIEHNIGFVRQVSDTLTVMSLGRVIAEGDPEVVLARGDVRAAYFGEDASATT